MVRKSIQVLATALVFVSSLAVTAPTSGPGNVTQATVALWLGKLLTACIPQFTARSNNDAEATGSAQSASFISGLCPQSRKAAAPSSLQRNWRTGSSRTGAEGWICADASPYDGRG
jgi:hypothetical protein